MVHKLPEHNNAIPGVQWNFQRHNSPEVNASDLHTHSLLWVRAAHLCCGLLFYRLRPRDTTVAIPDEVN